MGNDFRPGDRSPRADDRYQFLEAILAARSHLYLSYVGQSIRTGEVIPPSVAVTEFLELIETYYGFRDIVVQHPLHPFSGKYFVDGGDMRLISYNDYFCRTAEVLQQGPQGKAGWWHGRIDEEVETVHLADLFRFAANPQKFFVIDRLGIRLDIGAELPDEREMFEPSGLDRYVVDQELVRSAQAGKFGDCFAAIKAEGRWPLGTPGMVAFSEKQKEVENFLESLVSLSAGQELPAMSINLVIGRYRLVGTLADLHENGGLLVRFGDLRGRDILTGWIHHLVTKQLRPVATTWVVGKDAIITFGRKEGGPDLEKLLTLFAEGSRRPLPLFIEPGFAYARQLASEKARTPALDKAIQVYCTRMEQGYEPEWQLLYANTEPDELFGEEFVQLCLATICPVWSVADES